MTYRAPYGATCHPASNSGAERPVAAR
jgi:hypothetical protein